VRTAEEASKYLALSSEEVEGFRDPEGHFQVGITPYYMSIMGDANCPIRRQALPRAEEFSDDLGQKDPLEEKDHEAVPEVVHVYPDRVAFCVAQLCPVYCRYCFRKRRDEEDGLHFNRKVIERGVAYIRDNPAIKDVLLTGGDPFVANDRSLRHLLESVRAIPHVEVIRFGTRTPVTLPQRITPELVAMLKDFHPLWLNTHFNCAEELTAEAQRALRLLADAGIPLGNQAVLLKGVNDSEEAMKRLCQALIRNRVRPYYVFHAHMIAGTEHLRVPVWRGLEIMKSLRGNISGYAIPSYIVDTPSGKVPIAYNHMLAVDGNDLILEDIRGEIWREKDAMNQDYQLN